MLNQLIEKTIDCPYCGENIDILVDTSVDEQSYIEDCQVCCRPIQMQTLVDHDGNLTFQIRHENE